MPAQPGLLGRSGAVTRIARAMASAAGLTVAGLGVAVLFVGWGLSVHRLTDLVEGYASMKANTALGFLLTGSSLWSLLRPDRRWKRASRVIAGIAIGLASAALVEYTTGVDLGIDQLVTPDHTSRLFPGRMAPATAVNFIGIGLALMFADSHRRWPVSVLAGVVGLISFTTLVGYAYDTSSLYTFGPYGSVAPHTAICFLILTAGVTAARPQYGLAATLMGRGPGSRMARRFVPATILLPVIFGWACLQGVYLGWYGTPFGVALVTMASSIAFLALTLWVARQTDRAEVRQRRIERDLEVAERRAIERAMDLAAIVDASQDAVIGASLVGTIRIWNRGAERLYGYSPEEAIGQSIRMLVPPDRREEIDHLLALVADGQHVTNLLTHRQTKSGELVDISLSISPVTSALGATIGSSAVARDVSELREENERFRLAVEASPSGMMLVDGSGRIVLTNHEVERMFGYGESELIGKPVELLVPARTTHEHVLLREGFLASAQSRRMGHGRDVRGRRKDGTEFPAEIGLNPLMTRGGPVTLGVIVDVSDRQAMLRQLGAQAAELTRSNEELTQFAYVASHDLQEPLRMVASYTELLSSRYRGRLDERADKYIGYILEGATRMQQLIRDLLAYARVGTDARPKAPVDMNEEARRVLADLTVLIGTTGAEVTLGTLPTVLGDETQMRQVLQNLIANAIKFRGQGPPRVVVTAAPDAAGWRFTVQDNGIGIDMKFHDRVFEIFQRLHQRTAYEGSGVGLAIVKRVVERHGGRIWFDSTPGAGTRFYFTLPSA